MTLANVGPNDAQLCMNGGLRKFLRADHRDLGNLDWLAISQFLPLCDLETSLTILVIVAIHHYHFTMFNCS